MSDDLNTKGTFEHFFREMCEANDISVEGDYAKDVHEYCRLCFYAGVIYSKSEGAL